MKIKLSKGEITFNVFNYALMAFLAFITLYPMYYVAINSVSAGTVVARGGVSFWPSGFTLSSYNSMFQDSYFVKSLGNTVVYTVVGTLTNLLMSVLCAYPLSIQHFSGNKFFTRMVMITMFFSGGMIPSFLVVKSLGLMDSMWALILPVAISTYNMIVIRTFFQGIPLEMRESAHIDGANDITLLFRIYLPLSMPVLATMTLFYATSHWNSYFSALIYITDKAKYPVQLILRNMLINDNMAEQYASTASEFDIVPTTLKYASIMISTLPILIVYPFVQRYFVKGVMIGSLKG